MLQTTSTAGIPLATRSLPGSAIYVPPVALSESGLCDWIASALVGQGIQYHDGHLVTDRSDAFSDLDAKERSRVHAVARRAWMACELGLVHLFSIRVGPEHFRYIAQRSRSKLTPPEIRTRLRLRAPNAPKRQAYVPDSAQVPPPMH
jgi:hypothetical protein